MNNDNFDDIEEKEDEVIEQVPFTPDTTEEAVRKSGLAYSAGLTFVVSVVVMLGIGWGLDKFLNTAPWLMVIGIILGSLVGFYQLFKISSQIIKKDS